MFEVVELAELSHKAASVDVGLAADDELCAAAIELERARASLDAAEAHVLAELEVRGVCDREFGLSTAAWLADRPHASRPHLAARVRVGGKLRTLAALDAALTDGHVTFEHARALADAANPRIADDLAAYQDELIDLARHAPYAIWRRDLGVLVDLLDQDGGYDPDRDLARNHLHLNAVGGDQVVLSGELVGEAALEVSQAVEAEADRLWRQHRDDHELGVIATIPRRSTLLALALVSLCRKGQATDVASTCAPGVDITLVLDDRAAPHGAADSGSAADSSSPPPEPAADDDDHSTGDRATDEPTTSRATTVRVTPTVIGLTRGLMTLDGDPLDARRYAHLLCDANFRALITDSLGVPLDLGRSVRLATPAQRRALAVRDGGCVFPGCDAPPSWSDVHHVIHWERGGSTDLPTLARECRRHHGITHRQGWQMQANPDQTFTWTTPTGLVLTSQRQRGRPPNPALTFAA